MWALMIELFTEQVKFALLRTKTGSVGWGMSRSLDARLAMDALNMAISRRVWAGDIALRPGVNLCDG